MAALKCVLASNRPTRTRVYAMPRMNLFPLTLAVLLALAGGHALAGQYYKWVDEKGVTHYGEKPPANTQAATVKVRDTTSSDAETELQRLDTTRTESANAKQKAEEAAAIKKATELPADERERVKTLCDRHRKNLENLRSGEPVQLRDPAGKARAMTEEERNAQLRYAESEVQRCEQYEKASGGNAATPGTPSAPARQTPQ